MDCMIEDCRGQVYCKGWCRRHYTRWYRHGDPLFAQVIRNDDPARFARSFKVDPETGCHLWTELLSRRGYAKFFAGGKTWSGYSWAWVQLHGPVPDALQLDHFRCSIRRCVNPDHVRPVTARENALRSNSPAALNQAKTHCVHDHAFTPENTWIDKKGSRHCRECGRRRVRARRSHGLSGPGYAGTPDAAR